MTRVIVCILASLLAATARADSDGYFCNTSDYIAYETQGGGGFPTAASTHQLHVLPFGSGASFKAPFSVDLPAFQTHGLRCEDAAVTLLAWLSTHRIELGRAGRGEYRGASPLPAGCIDGGRPALRSETCGLADFDTRNLGHFAKPGTYVLRPDSGDGAVELVVERTEGAPEPGAVLRVTRSALVVKDGEGRELARREIFDGTSRETVD